VNDDIKTTPAGSGGEGNHWLLHSGGRVFGPLSSDELRSYFTSGMVKAADLIFGADASTGLPAVEVAALLGVAAPLPEPSATVAPAQFPSPRPPAAVGSIQPAPMARMLSVEPVNDTGAFGRVLIALWIAALVAAQFFLIPKNSLGDQHTLREFIGSVLGRSLVIAAICFALWFLLGKLTSSKHPSVKTPLLMMTLVYAVLLGNHALHPEAPNAPHVTLMAAAESPAPAPSQPGQDGATREPQSEAFDNALPPAFPTDATLSPDNVRVDPQPSPATAQQPMPDASTGVAVAPDLWSNSASELFDKQDWEGLEHLAQRWTLEQPSQGRAWAHLGLAQHHLRKFDDAQRAFVEAVRLSPNDSWVLMAAGVLYTGIHDYVTAAELYRRALAIDPNFVGAWNNLGGALSMMKQHEAAIDAWQHVARLDPNYVRTWNNLGSEYYALNQFPKSIESYQKALALEPGNEWAKTGLAQAKQR
jgi:hypothetical protein